MSKVNEFNVKQDIGYGRPDQGPSEALSPPPYTRNPWNNESRAGPSTLPQTPVILPPPPSHPRRQTTTTTSTINPNLPPRCNYLVERKSNASVNGTWHVDTAMLVPPSLLPPFAAFDGIWNFDVQNARRKRDKEQKKRDGWWSKMTSGERPVLPMIKEVRPNLMLHATNGGVSGKIHIVTSDRVMRDSFVVAEGHNGSVGLSVYTAPGQPLRIHATSTNGSVNVKIPSTFQGALTARTTNGSIKLSDGIKSKLTTFSSTLNSTRCFIGDWQASHFGGAPTPTPAPTSSQPTAGPSILSSAPLNIDPFQTWTGSSIHIASTNGSVSLSWVEEDVLSAITSGISRAVKSFVNGIFGGGDASMSSASGSGSIGNIGRASGSGEGSRVPGSWGAPAPSSRNDGPSGSGVGGEEWPGDSKRTRKGYSDDD